MDLPKEIENEIRAASIEYVVGREFKGGEIDFAEGAKLFAKKYLEEKRRTREMLLRLKGEFVGDQYWTHEIEEFLNQIN